MLGGHVFRLRLRPRIVRLRPRIRSAIAAVYGSAAAVSHRGCGRTGKCIWSTFAAARAHGSKKVSRRKHTHTNVQKYTYIRVHINVS